MITSKDNELIKHIKSLHQKKYREIYNEYFIEGHKLVQEAIEEKVDIKIIIICEEIYTGLNQIKNNVKDIQIEYVDKKIFEYISDTETPQGILAIIKINPSNNIKGNIIFALDDIRDPGNLGTIIRTLDCAGINELLISKDSADIYNPKVIRSTMGAIYRVNTHTDIELLEKLKELQKEGYRIIVTTLNTEKLYYDINFKEKCVIVIGNESKGIRKEIQEISDIKVKIPMLGRTESLNAATAASIIAYEYVRRRYLSN